jgi:hypothetical protein
VLDYFVFRYVSIRTLGEVHQNHASISAPRLPIEISSGPILK